MLVADRKDEYFDTMIPSYTRDRSGRVSYYDDERYDDRYEAERRGTSDAERERLMGSLERRGSHGRVERRDESRYSFYASETPAVNNYDRLLDRRAAQGTRKEKKVFNKKKLPLVIAYFVFALAAVIGITLSVVGVKTNEAPVNMSVMAPVDANAEESIVSEDVSAAVEETPVVKSGGEMYVMLKNGELVAVEVPAIAETTKEEEKWFDKCCNWLNGIFGGGK